MGLLDLPAPFFDFVDRSLLGALPPLLRLILWAIAGAAISLTLYRLLSPQRRIAQAKAAAVSVAPEAYSGQWQPNNSIEVRDQSGAEVARLTLAEPVTHIEKRQWW